jgi:periplasmic copper chaperone A
VATYRPDDQLSFTLTARCSDRSFGTIDNSYPVSPTHQSIAGYFVVDTRVWYRWDGIEAFRPASATSTTTNTSCFIPSRNALSRWVSIMHSDVLAAALLPLMTLSASAYIVLAEPGALPGKRYVAHFRVEHGCGGSPTIVLQVLIPTTVSAVAPETPPGWSLATVRVGGRITMVTWKGGSLPAHKQGEFTVAMTLPLTPGILLFPATQICEKGVVQWMDLPVAGAPRPKNPAPMLIVSPTPAPVGNAMPAGRKM